MISLQRSATNLLNQLGEVLIQLTDVQYQQQLPVLNKATIGQHVRHTLEFFICLIDARNDSKLNYDNRNHDAFIEEETKLAQTVIHSIQEFLQKDAGDRPLVLEANYDIDREENVEIPSTFCRELAYNIEHAIHHMALIKIGVKNVFPEVKLPDHFGVASSTVRYQKHNGN